MMFVSLSLALTLLVGVDAESVTYEESKTGTCESVSESDCGKIAIERNLTYNGNFRNGFNPPGCFISFYEIPFSNGKISSSMLYNSHTGQDCEDSKICVCQGSDPNPCGQYNGTYGGDGVCCAETCSVCGGKGCSKGGNKARDCCSTRITLGGKVCGNDTQQAPCTILELIEDWRHFYLATDVNYEMYELLLWK